MKMSGSVCCHVARPPKYCALMTATCADDTEGLKTFLFCKPKRVGFQLLNPP